MSSNVAGQANVSSRAELRAEPRVPVALKGTLTLGERSVHCAIQNMCSRGFLIRAAKELPVGQHVHLTCELEPGQVVECVVQVRHVNRDCLGAKVTEMTEAHRLACRAYLEARTARLPNAA